VRPPIELTAEEQQELERRARSRMAPQRRRLRAQAILLAAQGLSNRAITREIGLRHEHVGAWRRRFVAEGLAGLEDRPRPGRPQIYGDEARRTVARILAEPPPARSGHWTIRSVTEAVRRELGCQISQSQARRILLSVGRGPSGAAAREKAPVA
jgi:transposase